MDRFTYNPIGDYGVIGNTYSAALVGLDGSIDWCCLPRFDSPSVFAAILDCQKGGHFRIAPVTESRSEQAYLPGTNVLKTTFCTTGGEATLIDFMPCWQGEGRVRASSEIHRLLRCKRGELTFKLDFQPRFDYARAGVAVEVVDGGAMASGGSERLALASTIPLWPNGKGAVATFTLKQGEEAVFVLRYGGCCVQIFHGTVLLRNSPEL